MAIPVAFWCSGTPTTPALDGAHVYARSEQVAHPDHTVAVVVVTDGVPRDCASTVAGTSAVASGALAAIESGHGIGPALSHVVADELGRGVLVRLDDGAEILVRKPADAPVSALAWNEAGNLLAFGAEDGAAGVLDLR